LVPERIVLLRIATKTDWTELRIPKNAGSCPSAHIALTSLGARGRIEGVAVNTERRIMSPAAASSGVRRRSRGRNAGNAIEVGSSHAEHFADRAGGDLLMTGWRLHGAA